ncbi:MAG: xanthine dehydrogenase family protein molybdopterin-binding subunit [Xanthobacteraceae bacterium]
MIGQPISRLDGPVKVTGRATYAYEYRQEDEAPLYGVIVTATIGRGQIQDIDVSHAQRSPGVCAILTHQNTQAQGARDESGPLSYWRARPTLASREIGHYGEPVALVVAATLEEAQAGANLVRITYVAEPGHFDFVANTMKAYAPKQLIFGIPTDSAVGNFDAEYDRAAVKIDHEYHTSYCFSQPMEPNACLAVPRGEDLVLYVSTQIVDAARSSVANTLKIDPQRIQIVSPYVGGGFGSKLSVHSETILAAIAARHLNRPVKVGLTRRQIFHDVGARPTSIQRIRLGAERDGRLVAIAHDATMHTNPQEEFVETSALATRSFYAAPHRLTRHRLVPLDMLRGEDVRAPGEASGLLALESAMDELAHAINMDPIELRSRNEPTVDPERNVPYSQRRVVECLREGARRFKWERRQQQPGMVRDGRWLIGFGVAAAVRVHPQGPAKARVRLAPDGTCIVLSDMTDIGTGTYTVLAQVAAERLGLRVDQVRVELGRSDLPATWGSGGSWGASSSAVAVYRACEVLREKLQAAAQEPLFSEGRVAAGRRSQSISDLLARNYPDGLEAEGDSTPMWADPNFANYSIHTYGAHFAEVGVDADTAEIRLRQMLGVFSPGRVLNTKTARSQLIGGMTFGVGMALLEEAVVDPRSGAFVNCDLAGYLVPVHADIPVIDAVILDGFDDKANVLGVKGLGEVGICGAPAAIGNAVFNATGVRVRDFPITLDKLLHGLPQQV